MGPVSVTEKSCDFWRARGVTQGISEPFSGRFPGLPCDRFLRTETLSAREEQMRISAGSYLCPFSGDEIGRTSRADLWSSLKPAASRERCPEMLVSLASYFSAYSSNAGARLLPTRGRFPRPIASREMRPRCALDLGKGGSPLLHSEWAGNRARPACVGVKPEELLFLGACARFLLRGSSFGFGSQQRTLWERHSRSFFADDV